MTKVHSYVRQEHGKSVTVGEYQNKKNAAAQIAPKTGPSAWARPPLASVQGVFPGGRKYPGIFLQHDHIDMTPTLPGQKKTTKVSVTPQKQPDPRPKPKPEKEGSITWKGGLPYVGGKLASGDDLKALGSKHLKK